MPRKTRNSQRQLGRVGNRPETGEHLSTLGSWELWVVSRTKLAWWLNGRAEWLPLKLIATQPQAMKANYSLGLSAERFAENDDFAFLCDSHPELLPWLEVQKSLLIARKKPDQEDAACSNTAMSIIGILKHKGAMTYDELFDTTIRLLCVSQRTVGREVRALVEQGVIVREREGRNAIYHLASVDA